MGDKKLIEVKKNARFILVIDEDFNNVYLKDLTKTKVRLNAKESHEVIKLCFGAVKYIVNTIEMKVKYKEKSWKKEVIKKYIKIVRE